LGSELDAGFTSEPSNSIVARAAEAVDVIRDSDRQRGLSQVTPSRAHEMAGWSEY